MLFSFSLPTIPVTDMKISMIKIIDIIISIGLVRKMGLISICNELKSTNDSSSM
jgi:hypothetical protein